MKDVIIYTDGACSGNPGVGGWCAILMHKDAQKQISGYEAVTTNNRMELMAVIMGLKALKYKCNVAVYSDSAYVCNAVENGWLNEWMNNGWRTANKKSPVKAFETAKSTPRLKLKTCKVCGSKPCQCKER